MHNTCVLHATRNTYMYMYALEMPCAFPGRSTVWCTCDQRSNDFLRSEKYQEQVLIRGGREMLACDDLLCVVYRSVWFSISMHPWQDEVQIRSGKQIGVRDSLMFPIIATDVCDSQNCILMYFDGKICQSLWNTYANALAVVLIIVLTVAEH